MLKCQHPNLERISGDCDLCHDGKEYCPDCGYEQQLHEQDCPNDAGFKARNPNYIGTYHFRQIPHELRHPGRSVETEYGIRLIGLRRGEFAVLDAGLTDAGRAWLGGVLDDAAKVVFGGVR